MRREQEILDPVEFRWGVSHTNRKLKVYAGIRVAKGSFD
jgi:hypothetical protein